MNQNQKATARSESAYSPTNEELAIQYQNGDQSALHGLYEQNRGMMNRHSYNYYSRNQSLCARCGVTAEDLQQTAFFALEQAARAYNPNKGFRYTTFLHYHAQNCFNELSRQRTERGRMEPLSRCASLDEPLGEDESMTLSDAVPDPAAEQLLQTVENEVFFRQLHNAVETALDRLNDKEREVAVVFTVEKHCRRRHRRLMSHGSVSGSWNRRLCGTCGAGTLCGNCGLSWSISIHGRIPAPASRRGRNAAVYRRGLLRSWTKPDKT